MALLFMDSFDHYVTADLTEKWTSLVGAPTISAANGRRSSACLRMTTNSAMTLVKGVSTASTTIVAGFALKAATLASGPARIFGVYDAAVNRDHVRIQVNTDGSISALTTTSTGINNGTGFTVLGVSAGGVITSGASTFLEIKIVIHDTTGSVVVRVNAVEVLNLTSKDTAQSAAVTACWLGIGGVVAVGNWDFDDLYVCDGAGAAPWNTFLGDCRVDALLPTAAGATTGWTPSAGANWAAVDDAAPNDDTDYTSAATAGLTDTFVVPDAPVVGAAIYGIQHCLSTKKTDAGAATIAPVIRHGTTDFVGADLSPGLTYATALQIAATNPGTGAAWTEAGFNAAEFGYKRTV